MFNLFLFLFSRGRKDYYTFLISLLPRNKKLAEQTHAMENKDFYRISSRCREHQAVCCGNFDALFSKRERKKSSREACYKVL